MPHTVTECGEFCTGVKILYTDDQGCGLGLDASVSRLSQGTVVPRLGLASAEISNASVSPWPGD